jgi:AcrR family transcriptional regulator
MPTPTPTDSDLRELMIQTAIRLLAEHGPEALQVRRLAEAAGVSSMVVYSRFGGMPQLVTSVIERGFEELGRRFEAVPPTSDPMHDVFLLGLTYHRVACENPHLFDLMFGLSTPGGYRPTARPTRAPDPELQGPFDVAYRHILGHAERAITTGRIRDDDPERVAAELWSFVHGFVVLDLAGHFSHLEDPVAAVLGHLASHVGIGMGDTPERAIASSASALVAHRGN